MTKDQLSVGMEVMARSQFDDDEWLQATVADLRLIGVDPLVLLYIHYPNRDKWLPPLNPDIIVTGMRHINDVRLINEAQDKE